MDRPGSLPSSDLNPTKNTKRSTPTAPRRPHPHPSLSPQPWLIPSPPPHPQAPNRDFLLTLATGLPAGFDRGRRGLLSHRPARLRLGLAVDLPPVGAAYRQRQQGPLLAIPGRRRARAPAYRRRLRGVTRRQGAPGSGRECRI
jgi:hypothetical protein